MWATFNPADMLGDPFAAMPMEADGIRARLGLSRNEMGLDILLFVYALPPGIEPLFPTMADAYAGQPWTWYFRPSLPGEAWGRTMTWEGEEPSSPEVVHAPLTGAVLEDKIRIIKSR